MNKWAELLLGLILVVGVIILSFFSQSWGAKWNFLSAVWTVLKGGVVWFIFAIGILFIILGISDLKG